MCIRDRPIAIALGALIGKSEYQVEVLKDSTPEAYFQEAGRAGRDGQKAYAVLLYAQSDKTPLNKDVYKRQPALVFQLLY